MKSLALAFAAVVPAAAVGAGTTRRRRAPVRAALVTALAFALGSSAGCTSSWHAPCATTANVPPVHFVQRFEKPDPSCFVVNDGSTMMHVTITLENFYKGRCPGPIAEVTLRDPSGATHAHLATQNLPFNDCVYTYEKNETLASGFWTAEYAGGSTNLGAIVDVRPSPAG